MPHRAVAIRHFNRLLDRFDSDVAPVVLQALHDKNDLADVVDAVVEAGFASDLDVEAVREVVNGLPPSVTASVHAVLLSASERGLPVVMQWKPGSHVELQVWESVEDDVGQVGLLLTSPRGTDLATG